MERFKLIFLLQIAESITHGYGLWVNFFSWPGQGACGARIARGGRDALAVRRGDPRFGAEP
jgi:hypothetical protein